MRNQYVFLVLALCWVLPSCGESEGSESEGSESDGGEAQSSSEGQTGGDASSTTSGGEQDGQTSRPAIGCQGECPVGFLALGWEDCEESEDPEACICGRSVVCEPDDRCKEVPTCGVEEVVSLGGCLPDEEGCREVESSCGLRRACRQQIEPCAGTPDCRDGMIRLEAPCAEGGDEECMQAVYCGEAFWCASGGEECGEWDVVGCDDPYVQRADPCDPGAFEECHARLACGEVIYCHIPTPWTDETQQTYSVDLDVYDGCFDFCE